MARRHKTLKALGESLIKISDDFETNVFDGVRRAALVTDQVAVLITPVDTGYARSRWALSIGEPIQAEDGVQNPLEIGGELAAAIALSQAQTAVKKWKGEGSIWITNPLEYVVYLDEGSSDQAPEGISDAAIAAGQAVLREIKGIK